MADPTPSPTPTPAAAPWWRPLLIKVVVLVATALAARYGIPLAPQVQTVEVPTPPVWMGEPGKPFVAGGAGAMHPMHGWVADPDVIAANLDPVVTTHFGDTPAGKAALGDTDVFLWQAVRKVNNKAPPWYPNVDQQQVGCCVGCGWKHASDICQATSILAGQSAEWQPVSVEVIYGGSRVEVGKGQIRGDGSVGAWAAKWCSTYGLAAMQKYESVDLSTFSPSRARTFGTKGVPADIETAAKLHPVKTTALVKTWADVKRAIQQGYPVAVCSDQGFTMTRDKDGFARPSGTWGHCMCICGVRTTGKEGGFILNSWGDEAHTGPVWPADAPVAGFWADAATIGRMVGEGDSFALSDVVGFPARKVPVDWFIKAEPRPAPFRPADLFALAH
jgi:hypothetical protein